MLTESISSEKLVVLLSCFHKQNIVLQTFNLVSKYRVIQNFCRTLYAYLLLNEQGYKHVIWKGGVKKF